MDGTAYDLNGLGYAYRGPAGGFTLELPSLRIRAGETVALVGPNGAGKSTLLMILALLLRPLRGRLRFYGEDPWAGNGERTVLLRREAVLLTHNPYLFKGTVFDNVAFGLRMRRVPEPDWPARVARALSLVELAGWERRPVAPLSAGQTQRVALARALVPEPKVLLLDEPTANIEAGLTLRIEALLSQVGHESGTTIVLSTHDFSQASRLAGRILYLSEGREVPFSHENLFSGTASSDGTRSWIEPRPGARIVFPGAHAGRVTCVIDPASIRLLAASEEPAGAPNIFRGVVTRLEMTEDGRALVRVRGDLMFRAVLPLAEVAARDISLSRPVLVRFEPEAVGLVGSPPPGNTHHD
jgi:tungstate transport system ATP-binding protein